MQRDTQSRSAVVQGQPAPGVALVADSRVHAASVLERSGSEIDPDDLLRQDADIEVHAARAPRATTHVENAQTRNVGTRFAKGVRELLLELETMGQLDFVREWVPRIGLVRLEPSVDVDDGLIERIDRVVSHRHNRRIPRVSARSLDVSRWYPPSLSSVYFRTEKGAH